MPRVSRRRRELDELEEYGRVVKRARFLYRIAVLTEDMSSSDSSSTDTSGSSSPSSSDSSSSSSDSSSSSSSSGSDSAVSEPESATSSELQEELFVSWQRRFRSLVQELMNTRVLEPNSVPRASQLHLVLVEFKLNDPKRFRKKLRCEPQTFDELLTMINTHPIFFNDSPNPQLPVQIQFAIFLFRVGHNGNASSPEDIAQWAGVCVGTVQNSTYRVMIALLELHDQAIHLPGAEEKEDAKCWVEQHSCEEWRDGFCSTDGTKFPFFERPGLHGDAWFDKNKDYSCDAQLVTLPHNLVIIDYSIGHTGSVHDSWAFRSTRTFKEHDSIFGANEWMWADSAYPSETWTVTPFKKPVHGELTPDQRTFNYHVSKVRIRSEHAIGLLKGKFQSLRELRIQVYSHRAHLWTLMWVRCCFILHNLILRVESGRIDEEWHEQLWQEGLARAHSVDDSDDSDGEESGAHAQLRRARRRIQTEGQKFRLSMMKRLFDSPTSGAEHRV